MNDRVRVVRIPVVTVRLARIDGATYLMAVRTLGIHSDHNKLSQADMTRSGESCLVPFAPWPIFVRARSSFSPSRCKRYAARHCFSDDRRTSEDTSNGSQSKKACRD